MTLDLFGEDVPEKPRRGRSSIAPIESPPHVAVDDSFATIVAIYADESCLGNGREGSNPGGAGGVIEMMHPDDGSLSRWDYWIAEPGTTNNRMALRSVIEALASSPE
jgi:Ribonuclease HI